MSVIQDRDIKSIAEFEALLLDEMYELRKYFLTPEFNFRWYGRPEITELENKQTKDRRQFFDMIRSRYENIIPELFLHIYSYNYSVDDIYAKLRQPSSLHQEELNQYNKFIVTYKSFISRYDSYNLKMIRNKLNNFRNEIDVSRKQKIKIEDLTACSICLNESPDSITQCKHQFHRACIDVWLKSNSTCPLCRSLSIEMYSIEKMK